MSREVDPAYLQALSDFVCRTRLADIPEHVLKRARMIAADCLAVIGSGMQAPEMRAFAARRIAGGAKGRAWVIGTARRASALDAALVNGAAGTWLELDEGNTYGNGHPGIQLFPAALATAQERALSGEALLLAIIVAYEASSRIGRAARMREVIHPHGTYGVIGAAVAVGRLLEFDTGQMQTVINVAASTALASSRRTLADGATVRNIYTGHSAYMGQIATELVQCGFTGERDGVGTTFGEILSDDLDREAVVAHIGTEWLIADGYFKLHPTARSVHSAIDALEDLMRKVPSQGIDLSRVRKIEVDAYARAVLKSQTTVTTTFAARFSIPFAVASILYHGRSGFDTFSEEAVANPVIQAAAKRVELKENSEYTAAYPREQRCDVTVTLDDGTSWRGRCVVIKGEPLNPITDADVERKFFQLATPLWGSRLAHEIHDLCMHLETIHDLGVVSERYAL